MGMTKRRLCQEFIERNQSDSHLEYTRVKYIGFSNQHFEVFISHFVRNLRQ
jgi:hypothetical protein